MISVNCDISKGRVMRVPIAVASKAAAGRCAPRGPAAQVGSGFDVAWIMESVAGASLGSSNPRKVLGQNRGNCRGNKKSGVRKRAI